MVRVHGKDANFSFNAINLEGEVNSITLTFDVGEADATAFLDVNQVPIAGMKTAQLEIAGTVDPSSAKSVDTLFDAIGGGPVSTVYDLTGAGPGANDPEYQCTASGLTGSLVSQFRVNYSVGDAARFSATIMNSGATLRAVA